MQTLTVAKRNTIATALLLLVSFLIAPVKDAYDKLDTTVTDFNVSFGNVRVAGGLLIETAILIPVSILVSAVLIPPAFQTVYGANTTGWNAAVITVFQVLLPVLAIIAIAYQFIREITHGAK